MEVKRRARDWSCERIHVDAKQWLKDLELRSYTRINVPAILCFGPEQRDSGRS